MRLTSVSIRDLGARDVAAWNSFAAPGGRLISPYLRYEFARTIDEVRGDVQVLVAEDEDGAAGYMPFHRVRGLVRPAAAPMSDYQGLVARPGISLAPQDMLDAMRAGAFVYENWVGGDAPGKVRERAGSTVINVSDGAEAWFETRKALYKDHFKKAARRARRAEQEFGPARVEFGDPLGERFELLKAWKSAQYRKTGKLDLFSIDWVDRTLSTFASQRFGAVRGLVATLYYGDEIAAIEFGIAAGDIYHSWFPAYDSRFASVSPGLQLLHGVIEGAQQLGLSRIDLGKGDSAYKKYYADYEVPLTAGRSVGASLAAARIAAGEATELTASLLPGRLREAPVKLRRRWAQISAFEPAMSRSVTRMGEAFAGALMHTGR
ncbi:MAG: GNAT family N-acetyltransferase [Pseudomonadota bacterium]